MKHFERYIVNFSSKFLRGNIVELLTARFFNVLNCILKNQEQSNMTVALATPKTMKLAADMFRQAEKDADRAAVEFRKQVRKNKKEKKEKDAIEKKSLLAMAKIFAVAEKTVKTTTQKLKIRKNTEKNLNRMIVFKNVFGAQLFQNTGNTSEFEWDEVYPESIFSRNFLEDDGFGFTTAPSTPRSMDDDIQLLQEIVQAFEEIQDVREEIPAEIVPDFDEEIPDFEELAFDEILAFDEFPAFEDLDFEDLAFDDEVPAFKEIVPAEEETVPAEEEIVPAEEETVPAEEEIVPAEEETVEEEIKKKEEEIVEEEIKKKEEEIIVKSKRSKAPIVVSEYTLRSRRSL